MMLSNYAARPEFMTSKTAVWWDINDCPVPDGYDGRLVRPSIEGALKNLGYSGPVTITAYGDLKQTPDHVLRDLSSTGVIVQHTVKELRCSFMYSDLLEWREHNPSPATIMLISDQVEDVFALSLCREQQRKQGYNLLLAYTYISSKYSLLHTSAEWLWGSLLTDSETPRQVLRKCSNTGESAMFRCRSCLFDTQSLEDFTKHHSGEEHAQKEIIVIQSTRPSVGPRYEQSQIKRMPRNYSAPPEYATSKTAVWWDMRDCPVPDGYDVRLVRPGIEGALKNLGYSGPVTITAYGDIEQIPEHVLQGLSSTGVSVQHTLKGGKDLLLRSLPVSTTGAWIQTCFGIYIYFYTSFSPGHLALGKLTDRSCRFDAQSLEDFTKHLSGEEHAEIEIRIINQSIRPSTEYEVENSPKSKGLRKAFQTDFHFGNYFRLSNRGSRRGAGKEKLLQN